MASVYQHNLPNHLFPVKKPSQLASSASMVICECVSLNMGKPHASGSLQQKSIGFVLGESQGTPLPYGNLTSGASVTIWRSGQTQTWFSSSCYTEQGWA